MGYYQEAYDAECAAIARAGGGSGVGLALQVRQGSYLHGRPGCDCADDEPGPGQTYTIQARQTIAALRRQEPAVEIEIGW